MSAFKWNRGGHPPVHYTEAEIEHFRLRDSSYRRPVLRAPENPPSGLTAGQELVLYDPGPDDASVGEAVQFVDRAAPAEEPAPHLERWSWRCWLHALGFFVAFVVGGRLLLFGLEVLAWLVGGA